MPSSSSRSSRPRAPASKASAATRSASAGCATRTGTLTKALLLLSVLLLLPTTSGCYLSHLADGQLRLLRASRPIEEVLTDPETPATLREQLDLVGEARGFARDLGLEVGDQYTRFARWDGDRIVTAVVAARPGTVEATGFWFPIVGTVPYKGFFEVGRAEKEAAALRQEGMDVCVFPVPAYSTLGWLADPLTGPMLRFGPGRLVETLLHELVHATVYIAEQPEFNEGVATFIGEEASVRFWSRRGEPDAAARRRREVEEDRRLDAIRLGLRQEVIDLYEELEAGPERDRRRQQAERRAREAIAALPLEARDATRLAELLKLNDACLAIAATYTADLPAYERRLEDLGGDLPAFVREVEKASHASDPREALLGREADER